ncbi:nickel transport system substrate-binding protein [Clostridium tetanomorphum]|uniref:ABC transporter substrate-binding protein n=1 Tax=Clostridium tetanomorphum TaxID=1553 RepID=UPI000689CF56|nr:ABC transporter substrate-binding protein [Clostridium tetanomorphum]MBP1865452.1 nickel transport system substrate-binding protein [Clostridium tetanomorphum]NRS84781.1 nickel transport system substrate-binding protein [Clostridium tetanomorphum]SQB91714.1 heme-binding protein A [Clostridium tetanomorphum]
MKKKGLLLIYCLIIICILSACGKEKMEAENISDGAIRTTGEQQEKTATFCESWDFEGGFFTVLSPNLTANYGSYNYLSNFYDTLVKYDDNKIVPSLAQKWEISKDGREYTFHLKNGVKFSDGRELNSEAVKKSIENAPKLLGKYNGAYGITSTLIEKVEALDKDTVKIILKSPYYGALHDLIMTNTFGIMSPTAYKEDGSLSEETKTKTFGTGPYMYKGKKEKDSYYFVLNPYYTGEVPVLSSFNVKTIPDNDPKLLALQSGEIHMILGSNNISYDSYKKFEKEDKIHGVISKKKDVTRFLGLNASIKPFDDCEVRLAINHAIDKNSIAKDIFHGFEDVANTFLSPDLPYCNVPLKGYNYNVKEAEKILDNAGWRKNSNGIREKNGIKLEGNLLYMSGLADEETLASKISSDLSKI